VIISNIIAATVEIRNRRKRKCTQGSNAVRFLCYRSLINITAKLRETVVSRTFDSASRVLGLEISSPGPFGGGKPFWIAHVQKQCPRPAVSHGTRALTVFPGPSLARVFGSRNVNSRCTQEWICEGRAIGGSLLPPLSRVKTKNMNEPTVY
jgi:hypothetical protein